MDLGFLSEYAVPLIVGICLCVGYILKHLVTTEAVDKYIPLMMGALGVVLNVWISQSFTAEILLAGLFSGLSSTGLHQVFAQLVKGAKE